ncbi:MAG: protoporphyrinogen oxidase [Gammaproteobacteria bacterium]|nr:protoporphyrinogen oxidase [Gammaproteobacteria bacterium]
MSSNILIIGGGISGLSTAWWLAQHGHQVELWEAENEHGGQIRTTRESGYLTERAAGLLVNFRPEIDQLIRLSGLEQQRRTRNEGLNRYVVKEGNLASIPMALPAMMMSPLWSWSAKLRMMTEILVPRSGSSGESVSQFIQRRLGKELLESAFDPFISGTLASDPDLAEARSVLPRLTALEQRYGSLTLGMLVHRVIKKKRANNADSFSFQGGMSELLDALAATPGIQIRKGVEAKEIRQDREAWQVRANSPTGEIKRTTRQLIISTPANQAAELMKQEAPRLARLLDEIEYAPVAIMHLGLKQQQIKHPLDGTGFLSAKKDNLPFNGNLWMSRIFPDRAPAGHSLLTTYLGGIRHPEQLQQSDQALYQQVMADLAPLLGIEGDQDYLRIDRHSRGLPLYHGHYQARLDTIQQQLTQLPGLHLCANYLGGVSVRERIFKGLETAREVGLALQKQPEGEIFCSPLPAGSII